MTWRLGWRTQKEMVWPEGRKPGSCRGRFNLRVNTSGVPQVELELDGGLGWEGGGSLGVPQGLELYVLKAFGHKGRQNYQ